jgi:hypothetical protein
MLSFGVAVAMVEQAETQHTVKDMVGKGERPHIGAQSAPSTGLRMLCSCEVRHIRADIRANDGHPKTRIQRRKLLVILNTMVKTQTPWNTTLPQRP